MDEFSPAGISKYLDPFLETQTVTHPNTNPQSNACSSQSTISVGVSVNSNTQSQSTALVVHTPMSDFSQIYNTIRQILPPTMPPAVQNLDSSVTMIRTLHMGVAQTSYAGSVAGSSVDPCSCSVSKTHSHVGFVGHAGSLAVNDWSSCEGLMVCNSLAPVTITSHSHVQASTSNGNTHNCPQRSFWQQDFTYEQVIFMNTMKKCWHWCHKHLGSQTPLGNQTPIFCDSATQF